jgi:hypothetical protein
VVPLTLCTGLDSSGRRTAIAPDEVLAPATSIADHLARMHRVSTTVAIDLTFLLSPILAELADHTRSIVDHFAAAAPARGDTDPDTGRSTTDGRQRTAPEGPSTPSPAER